MIQIRHGQERGGGDHGWLKTHHTFSFSDFWDPKWMGFRSLRVINEDWVAPNTGFPTHPHRDMEIITYVLEGKLEHKDSLGTGSVILPGDGQRMTAGSGIRHSEFNPSTTDAVHLLQIWILPEKTALPPSYEQKSFPENEKRGRLRLIASRDASEGSVKINQDAQLYVTLLTLVKKSRTNSARDVTAGCKSRAAPWNSTKRSWHKAMARPSAARSGSLSKARRTQKCCSSTWRKKDFNHRGRRGIILRALCPLSLQALVFPYGAASRHHRHCGSLLIGCNLSVGNRSGKAAGAGCDLSDDRTTFHVRPGIGGTVYDAIGWRRLRAGGMGIVSPA